MNYAYEIHDLYDLQLAVQQINLLDKSERYPFFEELCSQMWENRGIFEEYYSLNQYTHQHIDLAVMLFILYGLEVYARIKSLIPAYCGGIVTNWDGFMVFTISRFSYITIQSHINLSRILNYRFMIDEGVYIGIMTENEAMDGMLDMESPSGTNTATQNGRKKSFIPWIISFIAGALVVFLLMQFVVPLFNRPEAISGYSINNGPASGVTGSETIVWFQQKETPIPGKPYVEISFSENICYAGPDPDFDNGYGWNYTVYLTEYNGYDFYPETFEKYLFTTESHSGHNVRTADEMTVWWGESKIPARGQRCVSSGEPLQDVIGLGVKVTGKDANGEHMEFYGYMEYSQEIKE